MVTLRVRTLTEPFFAEVLELYLSKGYKVNASWNSELELYEVVITE